MTGADLLLHPVRWRIVQAFLGDRTLTTADLRAELSDVPVASLYRHVGLLVDAGVLTVVGERKVRGTAERSYRLDSAAASIGSVDTMRADDHRRAFRTFAAALMADFDRYLERAGERPDLAGDRVGYRQAAVWVTDEEFDAMVAELAVVLRPRVEQQPGGTRRRRLITTINLPAD
jgi:hypothetical protein